jgi:hypothetical protein
MLFLSPTRCTPEIKCLSLLPHNFLFAPTLLLYFLTLSVFWLRREKSSFYKLCKRRNKRKVNLYFNSNLNPYSAVVLDWHAGLGRRYVPVPQPWMRWQHAGRPANCSARTGKVKANDYRPTRSPSVPFPKFCSFSLSLRLHQACNSVTPLKLDFKALS